MAIPSSGPVTFTDIQTEFGGSNPIGLSEYYAGGGLVPPGTSGTNGPVPSSGAISVANFYGTTAASAPVNTVAPAVTGSATFGSTLTTTDGTWTGVPTPSFTYQWQRVTTNISGATSSTYVLVQADIGNTIRCVVTATNTAGSASANSNSTATVAATVPGAPTIGTATATGATTATVSYTAPASNGGSTITLYTATSSPGSVTGTLSTAGSGTITVSGLTSGTSYTFTVRATNAIGQGAASSASNSVTPQAQGFILTTSASPAQGRGVGNDGTNIYNYVPDQTSDVNAASVIKVSTAGSVAFYSGGFIEGNTNSGGINGFTVDASGNFYLAGSYTGASFSSATSKVNSSGTIQWSKYWSRGETAGLANSSVAVDSSGNVYNYYSIEQDIGCCIYYWRLYVIKLDSSGAFVYSRVRTSDPTIERQPAGIAIDSSNNYYVAWFTVNGHVIQKFNSAGTSLSTVSYQQASPFANTILSRNIIWDKPNDVGYFDFSVSGGSVGVYKMNSSSSIVWGVRLLTLSIASRSKPIAVDSSGNVYITGRSSSNTALEICKLNSSGTLQWARTLAAGTNGFGIDITVIGTKFVVTGQFTLSGTTRAITFEAPTDGSATGTYTNAGVTFTYATLSETASSATVSSATTENLASGPSYTMNTASPTGPVTNGATITVTQI
jgi:hypothetical protein